MAVVICTESNPGTNGCESREILFTGAVLGTIERNMADDSDWEAIVWDAQQQCVRTTWFASTRSWTYHNRATADATEEVVAAARAWMVDWWIGVLTAKAERDARKPQKNRRARSTTTRGKNKGVEGVITWEGINQYRSTRYEKVMRYGITTDDGARHFLDANQIEIINPEPVDAAWIRQLAHNKSGEFHQVAYPQH